MNQLAKALYDNTAECADELAFRKGDILTVMDQNVADTSGWWMCSLYGRHGLAPANRLKLLSQAGTSGYVAEKPKAAHCKPEDSVQNIYQIPSVPRPTSSPAYEQMDGIYKVPSTPSSTSKSSISSTLQVSTEGNKPPTINMASSPTGQLYDIPSQARRTSLVTGSTIPRQVSRKYSLIPTSELEKKFNPLETAKCSTPGESYVYAVPPSLAQDPNYDIPVPSGTESHQKAVGGFQTLPAPRKAEWLYDVPVGSDKQGLMSKAVSGQLYHCLPAHTLPNRHQNPPSLFYDTPMSRCPYNSSPPKVLPRRTSTPAHQEESVSAAPPMQELLSHVSSHPPSDHKPLECRGDDLKRVRLKRMTNFLACTNFHDMAGGDDSEGREDRGAAESQRISTASSSSTSSCDSLALSSSSPEPLPEVMLSQEEACRKLLDLQKGVSRAVPRLMEFVSSHWRCREHLEKHLNEIREAAEGIACSVTCFLNFALGIKGNTRCLTDANLQTRLYKQLSIVEDSGVILQQTVNALNVAQWPLHSLCHDPSQVHSPDQLERFVMVARTIPEDIKRLVSIVNANGKLLFRAPQKNPVNPETTKSTPGTEEVNLEEDDTDYVELQTQEEEQKKLKEVVTASSILVHRSSVPSDSGSVSEESRSSSLSEHCRLYFGALHKAIGGLVCSLKDGQPPEKFISQTKLVIMVGQRLVDTLCREAQRGGGRSLLCHSNQLCALLKQLAMATKRAALHFPDQQALRQALEVAGELAQRAQNFRISMDL